MTDQDANNNSVHMRENLVQTAVKFLQNPKVVQSPLGQKKEFLKRKGLTEEEIKRACDVAGVDNYEKNIFQRNNEYASIPIHQGQIDSYYHMNLQQPTLFYKIKEFFNTTALIGATIYFIFWFYEKFIKSFLFGRKKKKDIENSVSELDKTIQESMKDVKSSILKVEGEVQKLTNNQITDPTIPQLVQELKQDLSSLKALLLSRKQFPSAPASIPSWQLDTSNSNREKTIEREDDAGSGSSANNSDSSLEMIREDPPKE